MNKKPLPIITVQLDKIVGGGQALGTLPDGKKLFVWGGLPEEIVEVQLTKKKASYLEGYVVNVLKASSQRITPKDQASYLSTSPWQIMTFAAEQQYKADLIDQAFALHHVTLPGVTTVYSDGASEHYRNKVEFSWYGQETETGSQQLDLAFFRRGSKGKVIVDESILLPEVMMTLARDIRDFLQTKQVSARDLKTLLIRCDQAGHCVWQLYVKTATFEAITTEAAQRFPAQGGEVIYSNPLSPASIITTRLLLVGDVTLRDTILNVPFRYTAESFFQINLPVYQQALLDMQPWIDPDKPVVDLYSGVGSIGLTIGGHNLTLVELNEHAVREMRRNITELGREGQATAIQASSETALDTITRDKTIIVDPPRAGLHRAVINRLAEVSPARIIYLSCNPVTQARDIALLSETYEIIAQQAYNFFPRTPHIEHLIVLQRKN